jgi:hypothetical protein
MQKIKYLFLFIVFLNLNGCISVQKKSYIDNFETFVSDVEANYKTYSEKDWEEADLKYENFTEVDYKKYNNSLTESENSHLNTLIGKYEAIKLKAGILGIKSQLQNSIQQASTFIDEIVSDTTLLK